MHDAVPRNPSFTIRQSSSVTWENLTINHDCSDRSVVKKYAQWQMFCHFVLIYQNNSNSYQGFSAAVHFIGITLHYWRNFRDIVIIFQMWWTVAGFQELAAGFWVKQKRGNILN